jgi:hypothetical protein
VEVVIHYLDVVQIPIKVENQVFAGILNIGQKKIT